MRRGKQKTAVLACVSCEAQLDGTPSFCSSCGRPTSYASYEEKTAWEVSQWRAHSERADVTEVYEPPPVMRVQTGPSDTAASTGIATLERRYERKPDPVARRWEQARREAAESAAREAEAPSDEDVVAEQPAPIVHEVADETPTPIVHDVADETPAEVVDDVAPEPLLVTEATAVAASDLVATPTQEAPADDAPRSAAERLVSALTGGRIDRPLLYRRCMSCDRSDWVLRAGRNHDETYRYWCVRCGSAFRTDLRIPHAVKPLMISAAVIAAVVLGTIRFV